MTIDLDKIKQIEIPDGGNLEFKIENNKLIIDCPVNGSIIDNNFNDVSKAISDLLSRVEDVESQLRLRVIGELNKLKSLIEK